MDTRAEKGMWANLAKGALLVLGGVAAVLLVDLALGRVQLHAAGDAPDDREGFGFEPDGRAYFDFVMDGDIAGLGVEDGVPDGFVDECFDPGGVGWARATREGSVVQVLSDFDDNRLFCYCDECLRQRGWVRADSGGATRASFVKGSGRYRWLFLDVTDFGNDSCAVVVLKEVA